MKAIVLTGIRSMEMRDVPDPFIQRETDVLLRLAVVGVCGSDVHYYASGRIGSQVVAYPFAVGHECSAVVEKIGAGVTRVKPGDRVAVDPAMSCGHCDQCRVGRRHTCRNLRFLGCPGQAEGCLSEYTVMPESCCFPIPAHMTLEQAALMEPLSIGLYSVKQSIPMAGATIAILGVGPIGLSVLLPARAQGAAAIYVTDRIDARRRVAEGAGATWSGNPDQEDVVRQIGAQAPLWLDAVFECCGQQAAIDQAVDLLKPGGSLMLVGIPKVERVAFAIDHARRKELCLQNVRRQNDCLQAAIDGVARGDLHPDFMITHRFPFADTQAAFDLVDGYREGVVKALIVM
jgi:L-iditol 2-dehydrogenase